MPPARATAMPPARRGALARAGGMLMPHMGHISGGCSMLIPHVGHGARPGKSCGDWTGACAGGWEKLRRTCRSQAGDKGRPAHWG
jgi:hypothetical protein